MKYFINVSFNFEGYHRYDGAPNEVKYLTSTHRHLFYVKAKIEVFHDDRELEFIIVKHELQRFVNVTYPDGLVGSCEMIAYSIYNHIKNFFPYNGNYKDNFERAAQVEVYEDNENGGEVSDLYA